MGRSVLYYSLLLFVLGSFFSIILSCRKKIDHIPGVEGEFQIQWTKIDDDWSYSLATYNNALYIGGGLDFDGSKMKKYTVSSGIVPVDLGGTSFFSDSRISDLQVYNDNLLIAGQLTGQGFRSLLMMNSNEEPTSFPHFTSSSQQHIRRIIPAPDNGALLVGNFNTLNSTLR